MNSWVMRPPRFGRRVAPMYAIAFATATSLLSSAWQALRAMVTSMIERSRTRGRPCLIT
jgi:hypothetical protein